MILSPFPRRERARVRVIQIMQNAHLSAKQTGGRLNIFLGARTFRSRSPLQPSPVPRLLPQVAPYRPLGRRYKTIYVVPRLHRIDHLLQAECLRRLPRRRVCQQPGLNLAPSGIWVIRRLYLPSERREYAAFHRHVPELSRRPANPQVQPVRVSRRVARHPERLSHVYRNHRHRRLHHRLQGPHPFP